MTYFLKLGVPIFAGVLVVSAIDIFGSIASRKYNFNYANLAPLSYLAYTLIGFALGLNLDFISTLCGTILVGLYDATIGFDFSKRFNANWGTFEEKVRNMSRNQAIITMLVTCLVFGAIGFFLSSTVND
jgi:hypothetical protein